MISGRFLHCFNLAKEWAPQAIERAEEQISSNDFEIPEHALSCASKVAKKIGATDEEMIMVAGFAGGMGLSGDGCGALSASIWMTSLTLGRKIQGKRYFPTQIKELLRVFEQITDSEYLCHKISGCRFKNIEEHSEFVRKGGCGALIDILQNRSKIITAGA